MKKADIDFCVRSVDAEGWVRETRYTFESFFSHDPSGCFIIEENKKKIGMCIATSYKTCGFLGELIIIPEKRGLGIGSHLMMHAISYLQHEGCRSIYLDGATMAVPLYERLGFRSICKSLRFAGRIEGEPTKSVRSMNNDDLETIIKMDRDAFGADRAFFLMRRFEIYPDLCLILENNGHIDGYIMGLPGKGVVAICPWFQNDTKHEPLDLLRGIASKIGDTVINLGIMERNTKASNLIRSLKTFEETEPSMRMVMGDDDSLGQSPKLFAIGSAAKG
jgi:ribosomal protein S18 acetylase RimI-like enzyme